MYKCRDGKMQDTKSHSHTHTSPPPPPPPHSHPMRNCEKKRDAAHARVRTNTHARPHIPVQRLYYLVMCEAGE